jgi:thymidylate synthase ThyX
LFSLSGQLSRGDEAVIGKLLESCGRVCYKSESKVSDDSYKKFLKTIIHNGHHSILEHVSVTAKIITNRAVSLELVRHRLNSFSQESTRYCNYSSDRFGNEYGQAFYYLNQSQSNNYPKLTGFYILIICVQIFCIVSLIGCQSNNSCS